MRLFDKILVCKINSVYKIISADPLVTCRDTNRTLHLERQPTLAETTICLPKAGGDVNAVCTDPAESLVYSVRGVDDTLIRLDDFQDRYCLVYYATDARAPDYCVSKAFMIKAC